MIVNDNQIKIKLISSPLLRGVKILSSFEITAFQKRLMILIFVYNVLKYEYRYLYV